MTYKEALATLHANTSAARRADGQWTFNGLHWHTEADAVRVVQACNLLDVPITDIITTRAWWTLVNRVAELEAKLDDRTAS